MLDPRFVILGAAISLIGIGVYAVDALRGRVKPNRVSWILWALAPLIAFAAELTTGVGWQSLTTLAPGLGPLLVLIAAARELHRRLEGFPRRRASSVPDALPPQRGFWPLASSMRARVAEGISDHALPFAGRVHVDQRGPGAA